MIIIEWFNLIKYQMLVKNTDIIATLRWVRLVHKCQIVKYWKQLGVYVLLWESAREGTRPQVLALMYKSGPPQFWYYNCISANIWYLILLILSIIIILRIFMFYIQRVLADICCRKDTVVGINILFIAHFICTAQSHAPLRLRLSQIALSFRPQKCAKTRCL